MIGRSDRSVPDLFTLAPHSNETTSREAAKSIVPHLGKLEAMVLEWIIDKRGTPQIGCCAHELERDLKLSGNTVRPRVRELVLQGYVFDSGMTRKTPSGRKAIVWAWTGKP